MIQLTVGNSYSRITGLNDGQHRELKDLLSYKIDAQQAYFSSDWRGGKRSLFGKRGDFPTGLLYLVEGWLGEDQINYEGFDNRVRPMARKGEFPISLEHIPYQEQEEAANACTYDHRGILVAPTGVGKSLIIALIIRNLEVPTLIVVPSLELKRQLSESLADLFNYTDVGPGKPIWVENVDALDPTKEVTGYDCVIIDEFHHSGAKTHRTLNKKAWKNIYYRFGLTATPFRSNDNERLLLESVLSEVIYRIDYKAAVEKNYIVPLEAYYIDLPQTDTNGETWAEVYGDLVVENEARNKIIKDLIHSLEGQNVLTLVKEIKHGDWLRTISGSPFANGQDDGSRQLIGQFASGQLKSLIGTTGVLGEGVDTKPAEWVILAGLGKSKNAFMQQVGRAFRKYPGKESAKVILFRDKSHKWTLAHFNAQVKYLREEYGVKPIKLEIP
jgi:superfamily II DNA or RNA helicase